MKPAVEAAVAEIRAGLPGHEVCLKPDSDGGAYVIVEGAEIGHHFAPATTWVGFQITWAYPDADVYPHFIDPALRYIGQGDAPNHHAEGNLPKAMTRDATMPGFGLAAMQVSMVSRHRNAATHSALHKLVRIIEFLASR